MSMHFSQLKHMKGLLSSLATCHHEAVPTCPDKARVLSLLLHTCDVSHPAKTWDLHHQVENKIQGVCRQSAKAKLKNRHFTGGYRGLRPFFSLYKLGVNFLWIREILK